jgi:DNA-binding LacI/PurR family transcriptional regulator
VVGFTGDEIARYTLPALTTMRQPIEEMGKAAVDMIMDPSEGYHKSARMLIPASLIEGASVSKIEETAF